MLRAGEKGVAIWEIDDMPTHGEDGNDLVGEAKEEYQEESMREAYHGEVKISEGAPPTHCLASPALSYVDTLRENPHSPH